MRYGQGSKRIRGSQAMANSVSLGSAAMPATTATARISGMRMAHRTPAMLARPPARQTLALLIWLVAVGLTVVPAGHLFAQGQTCEDQVRVHRELIGRYVAERARGEVETAGEMARLKKELERLTNERDAARAKLKEQGK